MLTDTFRAAAHENMIASLSGPLLAGAQDHELAIDGEAQVAVSWTTREPLLVIAPRATLDATGLLVEATVEGGGQPLLSPLVFEPYTEAGAFLPVYRPAVDAATHMAQAFTIQLTVNAHATDGSTSAVPAAAVAGQLQVHLLEGITARLLYLLGCEKARLRRQAAELLAMRRLERAQRSALDRIGAELGVPRFADDIQYDAAKKQIVTVTRDGAGQLINELDADYRRRLALYRPWLQPTPGHVAQLLNGQGESSTPNAGMLSALGVNRRFTVNETDDPFAVAVHIVASGPQSLRDNFMSFIRAAYLIWPENSAAANTAHAGRFVATDEKTLVDALRTRLRAEFTWPAGAAVAPALAAALDQLAAVRNALGVTTAWSISRAQDPAAGSRYELGLGVDLAAPSAADLDKMSAAASDPHRAPAADAGLEALLRSLAPTSAANDPDGKWLLGACGLQTVHRLNSATLYLSHLPTFGLMIDGAGLVAAGTPLPLQALYQAPGDPGGNAVLVAALTAAAAQWAAQGGAAWTQLNSADAQHAWDNAPASAPAAPAFDVFRAAGLPAIPAPATMSPQIKLLPAELVATLRLAASQSQAILAGQPAAADSLASLVRILAAQGIVSILPMITTAAEVSLVVSVTGLPGAGLNLGDRRSTGFRWYVVPIQDATASIGAVGSRTTFQARQSGLTAVVAVGFARSGHTSPYEIEVDLPDGALLNLHAYEFLMNLLDRIWPIGIMVNTFAIRQQHVDLAGSGAAQPLPPTLSRTYRQFRRARFRGQFAFGLDTPSQRP